MNLTPPRKWPAHRQTNLNSTGCGSSHTRSWQTMRKRRLRRTSIVEALTAGMFSPKRRSSVGPPTNVARRRLLRPLPPAIPSPSLSYPSSQLSSSSGGGSSRSAKVRRLTDRDDLRCHNRGGTCTHKWHATGAAAAQTHNSEVKQAD